MATIDQNGRLVSSRVEVRLFSVIEKGPIETVAALVVHQTGGATSKSTFQAYALGGSGAHFLIDKDGKIYQTARVTQKTHHVGRIRSRCYELHVCAPEDQKKITSILSNRDRSYGVRVRELHRHEFSKDYPSRYPTNSDSLGIELVGAYDAEQSSYEPVTSAQNASLRWLVSELLAAFGLSRVDVYRHPQVSYKQPSEAETANW